MSLPGLAWRGLRRQWRSGELVLIALALALAVAAMTAIGVVAQRVDDNLRGKAGQLLGADLVISGDRPFPEAWPQQARAASLEVTAVSAFPSMASTGEHSQLADVRAVDGPFPLRGEQATGAWPARGEVWVDVGLAQRLELRVGDSLGLGYSRFRIARVLEARGDAAFEVFSVAPRLVMHAADLPATGLIAPGSRVSYRLLLAGSPAALQRLRNTLEPQLQRGQRIQGLQDARPEIRNTLQRARQFLALTAMASVVLAAVALVLAARQYVRRRVEETALMRSWGLPGRRILALHGLQLLIVGVLASLAGALLGFGLQALLAEQLATFVGERLPVPSATPACAAFFSGVGLLFATAAPPLLRLRKVSPLRVLRDDLPALGLGGWATAGLTLAATAALLVWQAGEWRLGLYALAGFLITLGVAGAAGAALLPLARLARAATPARAGSGWRLGLAAITRRWRDTLLQLMVLATGIMALLLLTVVRADLLGAWQGTVPPDAPNRFIINLTPEQVPQFQRIFVEQGRPAPAAYPMVRGRLLAINDAPVDPARYADESIRRLVEREFNLSFEREFAQQDNRIVAGRWWRSDELEQQLVSVEEGIAAKLGIKVGDRLRWGLGGREAEVTVQSIRTVRWDSFGVNFFVVATPGVLADEPSTWVASFFVPPDQPQLETALVRALPNATLVNVGELLERIRSLIDRLASAVSLLASLTLLAGVLVVAASLLLSQQERQREAALLRALGASRAQLRGALLCEFALIGALAGLVAAAGALGAGWLVAVRVLDVPPTLSPWPLLWALLLGIGLALAGAGWLRRGVVGQPPLAALRQTMR
ncbi:MAG: FtsX-like permease family protein [Rhodocyclaceae bacterium]|nr:FtsX-like permease family protein [Rhodocyclaceae bacterium]